MKSLSFNEKANINFEIINGGYALDGFYLTFFFFWGEGEE